MIEINSFVVSFNSTHHAIKSEKRLKEENIEIKMIPTPREITASCGLSIKFKEEDLDKVRVMMKELIEKEDISISGIFQVIRNREEKKVIKID